MRTPFTDPTKLGLAVKRARLNAGLTQDALAAETGTTRKRIGYIEGGNRQTLGKTPEHWFATIAPLALATGDLSLVGLEDLGDRSELLSLRRDVDRLELQVRRTTDALGLDDEDGE